MTGVENGIGAGAGAAALARPVLGWIALAGGAPLSVKVALGAALLGATAGAVGVHAVLRRRALVGDVLSHAALPGVCLAFAATGVRAAGPLATGALLSGVLGMLLVALAVRWTRTHEDAAMGVVLSTFFGFGLLLLTVLQKNASGAQAGLDSYLFGEVASLTSRDVGAMAIASVVAGVACAMFHKELKLVAFDEPFARSLGWSTTAIDFAVLSAVAIVVVLGLPVCGVVLIAAMLIYPAAAARYWSDRLSRVVLLAATIGALAAGGGVLAASPAVASSPLLGWIVRGPGGSLPPPGPMIVLMGAALFGASALAAPRRGLLPAIVRRASLRRRVQQEHLLRALHELTEARGPAGREASPAELATRYHAGPWTTRATLGRASRLGLVRQAGESVSLTPAGAEEARRVIRAHRVWEQFLVHFADVASDHVDRDADDVEHLLSPDFVARLEQKLGERIERAGGDDLPASPHDLGG